MKKMLLLAIAAVTALSMVPAHASFSESGTILLPAPQSKAFTASLTEGGITSGARCGAPDPDLGDTQGLDGWWITLPEGSDGATATLTSDGIDTDVWFYGEGCVGLYSYTGMVTDATANESGTVPEGAFYAIVDNAVGANVNFTFSLS